MITFLIFVNHKRCFMTQCMKRTRFHKRGTDPMLPQILFIVIPKCLDLEYKQFL